MTFKDHFSGHADTYARHRPHYPPVLFEYLASVAPGRDLAWDCGTGNGQAALGVAPFFRQVIATDPSEEQVRNAFPHPMVAYRVAPAESSGLDSASVDLATVATALHWFERDRFYAEARRVLKPGGVLAAWTYLDAQISPGIDAVMDRFTRGTLNGYWPMEPDAIIGVYHEESFPFEEIRPPPFSIELRWTQQDWLAYLRTWSAVQNYRARAGRDPVDDLAGTLRDLWGAPGEARRVTWPLHMRIGRVP